MSIKPFVKWVGGKGQLLDRILPLMPRNVHRYHEPFVGGGAVLFALLAQDMTAKDSIHFESAAAYDANADLVRTYRVVRDAPEALIALLRGHKELHSEAHYYEVRAQRPLLDVEIAARFVYLNKTCFNGLYRVNRGGAFNVPFGKFANPAICDLDTIMDDSMVLQGDGGAGVYLGHAGFDDVLDAEADADDLVYFDPPYAPVNDQSFDTYQAGGFTKADHERLAALFKRLAGRGVNCLLSNSDTPYTRALYSAFEIVPVQARRNVNSKGSGRGSVGEIIVRAVAS